MAIWIKQLQRSLRAETHKSRNSFAVWLSLAGTVANTLIFFVIQYFNSDWIEAAENPWWGFVNGYYDGVAFMMLPLFVIILCSLVTFMEHRQEMWSNLYTLPLARSNLYWSKKLFTLLLFIAAHLLFVGGVLLSGLVMGLLRPDTALLQHPPDGVQLLTLAFQTVWTILGLLAFHFWISWRFTHFILPLLIGILGFVVVSLLGPGWFGNNFILYAYPIQYMPAYQGSITLATLAGKPWYFWLSPLYFVLFSLMGQYDVGRR